MMIIENKYDIGDFVYLVTDIDQGRRQVTGLIIRISTVMYELSQGAISSTHYDFEITDEKVLEQN